MVQGPSRSALAGEGDVSVRDGDARSAARGDAYPPLSLPEMFFSSTAVDPSATLLDFLGRRYSYGQIAAQARQLAAGLQAIGVGKGDRVGLFLPNVPLYVSAYYGALSTGANVVNYAPMWSATELAAALAETTPKVVISIDARPLLDAVCEARIRAPFPTLVVGRLAAMLPPLKGLLFRVSLRAGRIGGEGVLPLSALLQQAESAPVTIDPLHDVALVQYSSGTTGPPRAVRLSHQNLTANARQLEGIDPWEGPGDVMVGVIPLAGIFGNSAVLNRTVLSRGCIALLPQFNPRTILRTIQRTHARTVPGVPAMFQALLDEPALARTNLTSLRACISGGATLPEPLKRRFEAAAGAKLIEGYGLVEASGVVSVNPFTTPALDGSVGRTLPHTEWKLLDRDDPSRPAPPTEPGELAVAGPQVMLGYWNDPAADAQAFQDGWLRTGDCATINAEGFATIVDRRADVMQVGGVTVFPSLIEKVLLGHDDVREAVVIGIPDAFRGESPKAYATLRADSFETGESLRNWLNGRLEPHRRVLAVEVRDSLPRSIIGKFDRGVLRQEEAERARAFSSPG